MCCSLRRFDGRENSVAGESPLKKSSRLYQQIAA
jgi:hypothetical protein